MRHLYNWWCLSNCRHQHSYDFRRPCRFAGVSVGMLTMVVPMYIAEVVPTEYRGGLVVLQHSQYHSWNPHFLLD
jgi:hypothetical protein